jgi:hypothetical protein
VTWTPRQRLGFKVWLLKYLVLTLLLLATLYWGFDMKQVVRDLVPATLGTIAIIAVIDVTRPPRGRP